MNGTIQSKLVLSFRLFDPLTERVEEVRTLLPHSWLEVWDELIEDQLEAIAHGGVRDVLRKMTGGTLR